MFKLGITSLGLEELPATYTSEQAARWAKHHYSFLCSVSIFSRNIFVWMYSHHRSMWSLGLTFWDFSRNVLLLLLLWQEESLCWNYPPRTKVFPYSLFENIHPEWDGERCNLMMVLIFRDRGRDVQGTWCWEYSKQSSLNNLIGLENVKWVWRWNCK